MTLLRRVYARLSLEQLEDRTMPSVSVTVLDTSAGKEFRLIVDDTIHVATWLRTPSGAVAFRPHFVTDPNGFGSTFYANPFLAGGNTINANLNVSPDIANNRFLIQANGPIDQGGSASFGTWTFSMTMSYDPNAQATRGQGSLDVTLNGSLTSAGKDLNLGRISSNYLHSVPLKGDGTGDTGDIDGVSVSYAAAGDPRDFPWNLLNQPSHFPTDKSSFLSFYLNGATNQVDTQAQGLPPIAVAQKPSLHAIYQAKNGQNQLSAGLTYDVSQAQNFAADNIGLSPLVLTAATTSTQLSYSLDLSSVPLAPVAKQMTHSTEYFRYFLIQAYQNYVNRAPDESYLQQIIPQMQAGVVSDEYIEALFIGSPEYVAKKGGGPGNDTPWVTSMYKDLLFRDPQPNELDYWIKRLAQIRLEHGTDPSFNANVQAALEFDLSDEREGHRVQANYTAYLGRMGNASEVNYWILQFTKNHQTSEDLAGGFVGSDEYFLGRGKNNPPDWVKAAYTDILHRSPSTAEIQYWVLQT